ncbi:pilus assembly protein PilX [Pseudomonas sp. Pseusp122]|uniref:pilus assembly PilX family protein n=1 Tax=unclassified Pseudomonas TaxID=196821 RepID=UPI0039A5A2BE
MSRVAQLGLALPVSLIFLLVLLLLSGASLQTATLQEKIVASQHLANRSLQKAEAVLRNAEATLRAPGDVLPDCLYCLPPPESFKVDRAGPQGGSGLPWLATADGYYLIQNLGQSDVPASRPPNCPASGPMTLYRITAVAVQGRSRTVLETIYGACRIMWRQLQ